MSDYSRACPVADVPEGTAVLRHRRRSRRGRAPEGEFYAIRDECSHAEVPLEGDIDGTTLECWPHGLRFDLVMGGRPGCRRPSLFLSIL